MEPAPLLEERPSGGREGQTGTCWGLPEDKEGAGFLSGHDSLSVSGTPETLPARECPTETQI